MNISTGLTKPIDKTNRLYKVMKNGNTESSTEEFRKYSNSLNNLVKTAKIKYCHKKIIQIDVLARIYWTV